MTKKVTVAQTIRDHFRDHPTDKVADVARVLGVKYQRVYTVKQDMDKKYSGLVYETTKGRNRKADWKTLHISTSDKPIANPQIELLEPKHDPVNHPAHYKVGGIETIDFIEAKRLNYNLGNVVKYVTRADHKGNRKQDLEKAIWYLNRELAHSM